MGNFSFNTSVCSETWRNTTIRTQKDTQRTNVSWPNPKQSVIVRRSYLKYIGIFQAVENILVYPLLLYDILKYSKMSYNNLGMFQDAVRQLGMFQDAVRQLGMFQDAVRQLGMFQDVVRQLGMFQDVVRQLGIPRCLKATWNIEELPLWYHLLFIWCDIIRIKNDN